MAIKYPVYQPYLQGNEKKYVNDCLDSTWISSKGKYIEQFEHSFAEFVGVKHACAVNNGTIALHMALLALDIEPGDEIIVPTFTYIASVNAITYMNATPVFVDSEKETWQIDPEDIKRKITAKTKAIIIVHLYGHVCNMDEIVAICKTNNILLIEDCAEAIGSYYKGKHVGTFGDIATFSFFGNKTITTGEGGMVLSNNENLISKSHYLKNQGVTTIQYWHDVVGYNYRMTNICAAIGLAQLEQIQHILQLKKTIAETYKKVFQNSKVTFLSGNNEIENSYWMCSCLIDSAKLREPLRDFLKECGIETRPLFYPVHTMPIYNHLTNEDFPVANNISARGLNLPSYPALTVEDVTFIANKVLEFVASNE